MCIRHCPLNIPGTGEAKTNQQLTTNISFPSNDSKNMSEMVTNLSGFAWETKWTNEMRREGKVALRTGANLQAWLDLDIPEPVAVTCLKP